MHISLASSFALLTFLSYVAGIPYQAPSHDAGGSGQSYLPSPTETMGYSTPPSLHTSGGHHHVNHTSKTLGGHSQSVPPFQTSGGYSSAFGHTSMMGRSAPPSYQTSGGHSSYTNATGSATQVPPGSQTGSGPSGASGAVSHSTPSSLPTGGNGSHSGVPYSTPGYPSTPYGTPTSPIGPPSLVSGASSLPTNTY